MGPAFTPRARRVLANTLLLVVVPLGIGWCLSQVQTLTLPVHMILETLVIAAASVAFVVGWLHLRGPVPGPTPLLASAFLAIALLNLGHMLSFPGMPDFVTPSSTAKGIHFWLAERMLAGLALLIASYMAWVPVPVRRLRWAWFAAALAVTGAVYLAVLVVPAWLPRVFEPGRGLTPLKIGFEYLICVILAWAGLRLTWPRGEERAVPADLGVGTLVLGLSELAFASYTTPSDGIMLVGHAYGTMAMILLVRGMVRLNVARPYEALNRSREAVELAMRDAQEREARFQAVFDQSFHFLALLDVEGKVLQINRSATALVGRQPQEMQGRVFWQVPWWDPALPGQVEAAFRLATVGQTPQLLLENEVAGTIRFAVTLLFKPIFDAQGQLLVIKAEGRDITDARRNHRMLEEQGAILRAIQQGVPAAELVAQIASLVEHRIASGRAEVCLEGVPPTAEGAQRVHAIAGPGRRETGYVRLVEAEGRTSEIEQALQLAAMLGALVVEREAVARELAARERAREDALAALQARNETVEQEIVARTHDLAVQRQLLDQILGSTPVGLASLSAELVFEFANPYLEQQVLGEPVMGRSLHEIATAPAERYMALIEPVLRRGEAVYLRAVPIQRPHHGDQPRNYDLQVRPLGTGAAITGLLVIALDVTERHELGQLQQAQLDRLLQLDHMKDEFLDMVSHELRAPLSVILGATNLLEHELDGPLGQQQHQDVRRIHETAQTMLAMVNDMLDLSRIQSGKLQLMPRPVALEALLDRLVDQYAPLAREQRQLLAVAVTDELPPMVADEARLGQVVGNMIGNAVKYCPAGSHVTVRARAVAAGVRVEVADDGPGIEPGEREHLFERFRRGEEQAFTVPGAGLGLYICRQLVEAHGGRLGVESTPGQGSCFWFELPLAPLPPAEDRVTPASLEAP